MFSIKNGQRRHLLNLLSEKGDLTAYKVLAQAEMLQSDFARLEASHFPYASDEPHELRIELLFPRREVTTDEMLKFIDKKFRSVSFLELVALGITHPEARTTGHIVGLVKNPVYDHDFGMGYPVITSTDNGLPRLQINHGIYKWNSDCRFAAVRL